MSFERQAVITGIGILSPLGESPRALHAQLSDRGSDRACAAAARQRSLSSEAPDPHLGARNSYALDRPARLLAAAAELALTSGGWKAEDSSARELGLYVGTMFSSAHTISRFDCKLLEEGPSFVSPFDFANTVINAPSGQTAIWHGLRGVNMTLATGGSSGLEAIASAAQAIRTGIATCLLAGGVEERSPESMRAFDEAGLLCHGEDYPRPFESDSAGIYLSEGAALLLLEDRESARERNAENLSEIMGHGSAFDNSRRRDERRSVQSIIKSMRAAIDMAGVPLDEIDVICASANGLARVDRHEAVAICSVFESVPAMPPVSAPKKALGESLGAAGPLQCAAMIEAMRTRVIPFPVELRRSGRVAPFDFQSHGSREGFRTCLINSLSFDGHSCSLVISCSAA
jgi:3-oxoacyl-[acyl-carrier-protein] synthase II